MAKVRLTTRGLGAAVFLTGLVAFYFKTNSELKFSNLGSRPDFVPPVPTDFDHFILQFPVIWVVAFGILLFGASFLRFK
jgi:hypothetical protein